ncbi:uncharacterized protein [Halyomorpha halys]|uniref:uncharacterized protein isoform X2 n=1 Tax=Halyomorpha halys TaxID=286706 RepID=UPI0006D4D710|nr:uncharacterized protein LOC106687454 [Halyomorpha halys]
MALFQQEMIESFLPSEIARLVYGYLEEEECLEAAQMFLETSTQLKECLIVARKGRKFSTKMYGLSLVDLFDLLSETISFVKENSKVLKETTNMSNRLFSILQADGNNSDLLQKDNLEKNYETVMVKDDESIDLENQNVHTQLQNGNVKNMNSKNDLPPKLLPQNENKETPTFLYSSQFSKVNEKDRFSPHFIKIKEENDMEECSFELEDNHEEEDTMPSIEPEIQIISPDGNMRQEPQPTVNVIANPIMVGRPPQLLCQPYGMVHMVPAYPTTAHPSLSTALFMPQQNITTPQHPITVHHSQSIIQTTGSAVSSPSNTLSTSSMWPKPKVSTSQNHQASPLKKAYMRVALSDYAGTTQTGTKDHKISKLKQGLYQSSSKLRPIAPKITQSLDNGVRLQVVHTKENPLIEANPGISKRCLRTRRKSGQKFDQTAAPFFIDIQEICNET